MAGSRVVAVKRAVIDGLESALAADQAFNGDALPERRVEVSYGYDRASTATERVFTTRSRADTPPAAMRAGRNFRDEAGTFNLVVLVSFIGGSVEDAEDRAVEVGEFIEEWLADRKQNELGVDGLQTLLVTAWDLVALGNDNGHLAELTYTVRWTARLT